MIASPFNMMLDKCSSHFNVHLNYLVMFFKYRSRLSTSGIGTQILNFKQFSSDDAAAGQCYTF